MNGNKVDGSGDLAVAQPELPDIRIGDRLCDLRPHLADRASKLRSRHFPTQQHLIAHDDGSDDIRILFGKRDRAFDLLAAEIRQAREPEPLHDLEAMAARDRRNLVKAMVNRISSNAIGDLL